MRGITDVNYLRVPLGVSIAVAQIFMSIRTPYVLLVQAAGHYRQVKVAGYVEAGINIVLTAVLVLRFGIVGAIVGTIIANVFRTVMYGWYASKHMIERSFTEIGRRFLWMALVFGIAVGASALALSGITVTGWMSWLLAAAVTFGIHAAVLVAASLLFYRDDLKNCISLFRRLFRR